VAPRFQTKFFRPGTCTGTKWFAVSSTTAIQEPKVIQRWTNGDMKFPKGRRKLLDGNRTTAELTKENY
jgi:hypothetical protein